MEESCASRDIAPVDAHQSHNVEKMIFLEPMVRLKKYGTREEAVEHDPKSNAVIRWRIVRSNAETQGEETQVNFTPSVIVWLSSTAPFSTLPRSLFANPSNNGACRIYSAHGPLCAQQIMRKGPSSASCDHCGGIRKP